MSGTQRVYVTLEPRSPKRQLFSGTDLQAALEHVRDRSPQSTFRFAIWTDPFTPDQDQDVVVCVPVPLLQNRRAQAEEIVGRWDATWLLVESMPHRHRDAARQHLVDEVSMALLAAAIEGVGKPADEFDDDF